MSTIPDGLSCPGCGSSRALRVHPPAPPEAGGSNQVLLQCAACGACRDLEGRERTSEPGSTTDHALLRSENDPFRAEKPDLAAGGQSLDLDRPSAQVHERFRLRPAAGGGWEAVATALGRKLRALAQLGLTWVRIERDERHGFPYYAQFAPDEGGALFTEVAGNFYIDQPDARLDPVQLARLELGWGDPVDDPSSDDNIQPRNHTRTWPVPIDFEGAARLVVGTLASVYGITEEEELLVRVDPW